MKKLTWAELIHYISGPVATTDEELIMDLANELKTAWGLLEMVFEENKNTHNRKYHHVTSNAMISQIADYLKDR